MSFSIKCKNCGSEAINSSNEDGIYGFCENCGFELQRFFRYRVRMRDFLEYYTDFELGSPLPLPAGNIGRTTVWTSTLHNKDEQRSEIKARALPLAHVLLIEDTESNYDA